MYESILKALPLEKTTSAPSMRGPTRGTPGESRTPNRLIRNQVLYPLSYGRKYVLDTLPRELGGDTARLTPNELSQRTAVPTGNITGKSERPWTPTACPLVERIGRSGVRGGIVELLIVRDTDVGEPAFMDVPIDLENAVAAEVLGGRHITALAVRNLKSPRLKFVGPCIANDLFNAPRTGLVPEVKPVTGILVKEPAQKERTWWRSLASLERLAEPPAELNVIGAFADRVAATDAVWTAVYGWPVGIV